MSEQSPDQANGRVVQVNISPGGVPKLPVPAAHVRRDGLDGDARDHDAVHGGPHRAVCLLAIEAIERVRADRHTGVGAGAVGENLTTEGTEPGRSGEAAPAMSPLSRIRTSIGQSGVPRDPPDLDSRPLPDRAGWSCARAGR
ncbi:MAG: hypothetical protein M3Q66_06975 [Chloroflexota bacterium]|nr:hypothetical protein [Chloroflexota bacterium]